MNELLLRRRNKAMKKEYLHFVDPLVEQICATKWGDGTGITLSQAANVNNSQLGTTFRNNSTIVSFDELQYFTKLTSLPQYAFQNCSNLASIILPNTITSLGNNSLRGCNSLQYLSLPYVTSIGNLVIYSLRGLVYIEFSANLTTCGSYFLSEVKALEKIVFRGTTPPSINTTGSMSIPTTAKIYVPYSSDHSVLSTYTSTTPFSGVASQIYELNQDGTIPT